jgi:malonyl-CoA O-methyltransferase
VIADGFGRGAGRYEVEAEVQRVAAAELASHLEPLLEQIPAGPILEVGCGTGFLTRHLSRLFPEREMEISDLSSEMLDRCRAALEGHRGELFFQLADAEEIESARSYSLIAAGFVGQWFRDPATGLRHLARLLSPGGLLIASLPGRGSFSEWRDGCRKAGVEYPGIELPESSYLKNEILRCGVNVDIISSSYTENYDTPLHFFRHLRRIGAAPAIRGERVSLAKMRAILRSMDRDGDGNGGGGGGGLTPVNYELLYLFLRPVGL